jgi:hypothetical protein
LTTQLVHTEADAACTTSSGSPGSTPSTATPPGSTPPPRTADLHASGRAADFPLLLALLEIPPDEAPDEDPFEAGLARVLDGVAAHVDDPAAERS